MGIFSEADRHPFYVEVDADVVEDARGGSAAEPWIEHGRTFEYARSSERSRRLFIHDDQLAS